MKRKEPTIPERILSALLDDEQKGNGLSIGEIAKTVYGVGYTKRTKKDLDNGIKSRMHEVAELALTMNKEVVPVRKAFNPKTPNIKTRIICYKIYNPLFTEMKGEVLDELIYKKRKEDVHVSSRVKFEDRMKVHGLLPGTEQQPNDASNN